MWAIFDENYLPSLRSVPLTVRWQLNKKEKIIFQEKMLSRNKINWRCSYTKNCNLKKKI